MNDSDLEALAEAAGVQVHWEDADGKAQTVSPESLRRILPALGELGGRLEGVR